MRSLRAVPLSLLALVLAGGAASAQGTSAPREPVVRKVLRVQRVAGEAPRVDGVLDDAAWQAAQPAAGFVQRAPDPGAAATLATEARILLDGNAVYVAMTMSDPRPDSIVAPVGRRDLGGISSDWAHVFLDSYNDKRTAFRFSVNPAGVQKDALHFDDTREDGSWDAVWESAVRVTADGWVAEFRIPLSQLRFSTSGAAEVWGLQLTREVARRNEVADWSEVHPERSGLVSQFGELAGFQGLRAVRRLEVLPYTVASVTRAPDEPGNPFFHSSDPAATVGADLKYGLTSDLTLTATINPDFGQVEADPSVVNLTAFESFFAERRPFFTEGSDIFRFDVAFPYSAAGTGFRNDQPFYSRRLGRSPRAGNPDGADYYDRPEATTILAAAKLSGKTAGGWSVGLMDVVTASERVRWMDGLTQRSAVVEPSTNYLTARAVRDFRGGTSALGGIVTAVHRGVGDDPRLAFLPTSSYLAGLDGRHRFGGGDYEVRGSVLGTHTRGGEEAIAGIQLRPGHYFQRPDADHLSFDPTLTSLGGWLADLKAEKIGGEHWRGGVYGHARSPGLEMNELGFQRSTDWLLQGFWLGYGQYTPQGPFRRWSVNANGWNGWSFGGERLSTGINSNGSALLKSNWGVWYSLDHETDALRTDVLRGGPAFVAPARTSAEVGFYTDDRKVVSGEVYTSGWREAESGGGGVDAGASIAVRPGGRLRLSLGPDLSVGSDRWAYVDQAQEAGGTPHYVFASLKQTTISLTTRLDYALTPRLTMELYAQPFLAAGRYTGFREVVDPRAGRFADRFAGYPTGLSFEDGVYSVDRDGNGAPEYTFDQPDFNVKELRSNLVMRWEFRPGSTLFLVWSHQRANFDDPGSMRLGRDIGRLFDARRSPYTNVVLLKMNYWLNL